MAKYFIITVLSFIFGIAVTLVGLGVLAYNEKNVAKLGAEEKRATFTLGVENWENLEIEGLVFDDYTNFVGIHEDLFHLLKVEKDIERRKLLSALGDIRAAIKKYQQHYIRSAGAKPGEFVYSIPASAELEATLQKQLWDVSEKILGCHRAAFFVHHVIKKAETSTDLQGLGGGISLLK